MSNLHKRAMEAVLEAAERDIVDALKEHGIRDRHDEEADDVVLDVAILHAYRIFMRVCEGQGLSVDAHLFADMATELAEDMAQDEEDAD